MRMADKIDRKSFGRYEVLARIGRGGTATVYLARPPGDKTARLLALKVLHDHMREDAGAVESFLHEAQVTSRMQHVNVLPIIEAGFDRGRPFMVMDYVEGCSVADILSASVHVRPPEEIVTITLDVLAGLSAVHNLKNEHDESCKLVHRDVSPANLLVGVDGACRITDFGVTRPSGSGADPLLDTVRGTPGYVAPEIVAGRDVDARADVFSVGVVLWNALTGRKIFTGENVNATLFNVMKRRVPPPSQVGLRPPACLDKICLTAMSRDPARRFQSADEMAEALRNVALEESLLGSRGRVAELVDDLFGEQLAIRRQTLARLIDQRTPHTVEEPDAIDAAGSSSVPTLPNLDRGRPADAVATSPGTPRLAPEALRSNACIPIDEPSATTDRRAEGTTTEGGILRRGATKVVALTALLTAGLLGGLAWWRASPDPDPPSEAPSNRRGQAPFRPETSAEWTEPPPPETFGPRAPTEGTTPPASRETTADPDAPRFATPARQSPTKRRARAKRTRRRRPIGTSRKPGRRAPPAPGPARTELDPRWPQLERNP